MPQTCNLHLLPPSLLPSSPNLPLPPLLHSSGTQLWHARQNTGLISEGGVGSSVEQAKCRSCARLCMAGACIYTIHCYSQGCQHSRWIQLDQSGLAWVDSCSPSGCECAFTSSDLSPFTIHKEPLFVLSLLTNQTAAVCLLECAWKLGLVAH